MTQQTATQVNEERREEQLRLMATAPRVTSADVSAAIVSAQYHHFPGTTLTVCVLLLSNGHTVTGESACVVSSNFDEAIGRELAFAKARDKVWEMLGYELRCYLSGPCKNWDVA